MMSKVQDNLSRVFLENQLTLRKHPRESLINAYDRLTLRSTNSLTKSLGKLNEFISGSVVAINELLLSICLLRVKVLNHLLKSQ